MMRWDVVAELLDAPQCGAELGAHAGRFTENLLKRFPALTLYAIDTWVKRPGFEDYDFATIRQKFAQRTRRFSDRVIRLQMETADAVRMVPSLDFVFIDADHSYEAVAADIDAWRPKVKPGGILCGHDYGHPRYPGVKQAVDERFGPNLGADYVWWIRC